MPRLGRCSARAEPEGAGAGRSTPRGGLCASRRNALAVGQQPLRIRIIPPLRGVKLARLELGARVSPHGHIRTARSVLDGEVLRSTALRLRGVFRAEPVDQYVQAQPTVEGDGATDDTIAEELVRDRLARPQLVSGGVCEGAAVAVEERRHELSC